MGSEESVKVINWLTTALRNSAVFNPEVQVVPACILWPDHDRQWEAIIPRLQSELPELLVLGEYTPEKRIGPAIWLRCVIGGKIDDITLPKDHPPIFYLPGVSRQDLRAVENCPDNLKPLAELQYRGVIWSQINAKDWTILAFLKSDQGGLGLDVAQDHEAKNAMQLALSCLLDEKVDLLRGKRLDSDYFNTLLTGGDPVRDILQWLNQGDTFQSSKGKNEWKAFVGVCKSQFAFNPQREGILIGAAKLAEHEGPWQTVWERYCEAPKRYPNIPDQIRKCELPFDLMQLFTKDECHYGWPQWNEHQENRLVWDMAVLKNLTPQEARSKLLELDNQHGVRRQHVWAELGEAPLAQALQFLAELAQITGRGLASGRIEDLAAGYQTNGWQADNAVIQTLSVIEKPRDIEAVTTAIRSIYIPWLEDSARYLQKILDGSVYPGGGIGNTKPFSPVEGECVLFVDGLRYDVGNNLAKLLDKARFSVKQNPVWAALPSVTATGKAAVTPVKEKIRGEDVNVDFEPCVAETGQSLKGGYHLKKLLVDNGWKVLDGSDSGDGHGSAWCEFGDIDGEGHNRGWKLVKHIESLLGEIRDRIAALIEAGWTSVRVVTDHGWLLLPGGLPKIEMSSALTDNKWGRCASLKPGASTKERLYPWFWNPNQSFVLADGISCFRNGQEYAHGGLSLQECFTLELTVTKGAPPKAIGVEFTDVVWRGMRCTVAVEGQFSGLSIDLRMQPGESATSAVVSIKPLKDNGTASVVVEDEELEGHQATLVLLDTNGSLIAQSSTVIGGGDK